MRSMRFPAGFGIFVVLAVLSVLLPITWLTPTLGLVWALVVSVLGHCVAMVVALNLSAFIPRWAAAPTYTLHERVMPYRGRCPAFEAEHERPEWAHTVEAQFPLIERELDEALAKLAQNERESTPQAVYQPNIDAWLPTTRKGWIVDRNMGLVTRHNAWLHLEVEKHCPETYALLKQIPGFRGECSFSQLSARSRIKMHSGESDIYYRCHLGIKVPGPLPNAGFQVGAEKRSWERGRLLIFCDGYPHTAWNDYDEDRVILLFSVLRPEFKHYERGFFGAYHFLLYLKTGITGSREPIVLRPWFAWLTALNVIYVNSFGRFQHRILRGARHGQLQR